jgi:hypothetical protein
VLDTFTSKNDERKTDGYTKLMINLFKKQTLIFPTLWGWILVFFLLFIFNAFFFLTIHPFLAKTAIVKTSNLIVEGWVPDYCLKKVDSIYRTGSIKHIFVTGGPIERGSYLLQYTTFANLGALSLKKAGIPDSVITIVPAPFVIKDRTFTSAVSLRTWLLDNNIELNDANIVTLGVHSRRSQMVFKKVLPESNLGVLSIRNHDFDPDRWFFSSQGVKTVIPETISFLYSLISYE